ncbi:MAG: isopentenyl-diphosphate Delta-isomerase [Cyclobacteriaceae bacterium]|nr:isopentenyl-diphosphate Delta-isomerase [Cyclobacteriaceae bacterium]
MEEVILVDELDREVGALEKMAAHRQGKLHRAFSILVFNSKGELLLQKRALGKYHSGGLWTNTCCSHPRPGETLVEAGKRKLLQEMGFDCDLTYSHKFLYKVELDNNLIEHEWDHVLIGYYDGDPQPNREEAMAWKYVPLEEIKTDARQRPEAYTLWFKLILEHPELNTFHTV